MTGPPVRIRRVRHLDPGCLQALARESRVEGFRFLTRLSGDWRSGANRFDAPGEALFVVMDGRSAVAVCGLNVDPYLANPRVARLRHLYVARAARRKGVGRRLVEEVLAYAASGAFDSVRLRTDHSVAARFYEVLGFRRCSAAASATHELALRAPR